MQRVFHDLGQLRWVFHQSSGFFRFSRFSSLLFWEQTVKKLSIKWIYSSRAALTMPSGSNNDIPAPYSTHWEGAFILRFLVKVFMPHRLSIAINNQRPVPEAKWRCATVMSRLSPWINFRCVSSFNTCATYLINKFEKCKLKV